jgi:thiol-disulfide isomerase/thioredoxin
MVRIDENLPGRVAPACRHVSSRLRIASGFAGCDIVKLVEIGRSVVRKSRRRTLMNRLTSIGLTFTFVMGLGASGIRAQDLGVGDPAPKLVVKEFLKGEPISEFKPGKTYVVEFWATWCPPCRESIPHLTELQKKKPDVTFIGVSAFEHDEKAVKPFVEKMGAKMDYRVALDSVPDKEPSSKGAMAQSWMNAAAQNGIPTAFIVDKDGKIAWIGHPMSLEEPLDKIASGSWDLKAAREEFRKSTGDQVRVTKLQSKYTNALRTRDPKKIVAAVDEIVAEEPSAESTFGIGKLGALIKLNDEDKALEYAEKLAKSAMGDHAQGLNGLAWAIVDPALGVKPSKKLIEFALRSAKRADELGKSNDAAIADTLARAYFASGDASKAVEHEERALRLAKGGPAARIAQIEASLERYKAAADKK